MQNRYDLFTILPADVINAIMSYFPMNQLLPLKRLSKTYKKFIEKNIFDIANPKHVIDLIGKLPAPLAMKFIACYRQTPIYKKLREKCVEGENLQAFEVICYALTTSDLSKLKASHLEEALIALTQAQHNIHPDLLENLYIMIAGIAYTNKDSSHLHGGSKDLIDAIYLGRMFSNQLQERQNNKFMNLAGLDFSGLYLKKGNLASSNLENCIFSSSTYLKEANLEDVNLANAKEIGSATLDGAKLKNITLIASSAFASAAELKKVWGYFQFAANGTNKQTLLILAAKNVIKELKKKDATNALAFLESAFPDYFTDNDDDKSSETNTNNSSPMLFVKSATVEKDKKLLINFRNELLQQMSGLTLASTVLKPL